MPVTVTECETQVMLDEYIVFQKTGSLMDLCTCVQYNAQFCAATRDYLINFFKAAVGQRILPWVKLDSATPKTPRSNK